MPASTQVRPSSEWQLVSAVALERKPVITRDFNEFERRYLEMLRTMEVEASLLSDHELQVKAESQRKASTDEGSGIKIQTANDIAEEWHKKAKEFQPASRLTGQASPPCTGLFEQAADMEENLQQPTGLGNPGPAHAAGETMRQVRRVPSPVSRCDPDEIAVVRCLKRISDGRQSELWLKSAAVDWKCGFSAMRQPGATSTAILQSSRKTGSWGQRCSSSRLNFRVDHFRRTP
ncbi:hypothetical protein HPB47_014910 [Ixodes persulcatus]|uniref:Uncharacterized protein n=1 Tax=Ixodes persulcatus TaxID=34615 RepID=A0AC60QV35_IXOPE|nr:hypothetical protein HPB47_014910 [Ixodes persulcatus]